MTWQTRNITLTAAGCTAETDHVLGCITCGARAVAEIPQGFVQVSVVMTVKEFDRYRIGRMTEERKTHSEAVRRDLGLPPTPEGLLAAYLREI